MPDLQELASRRRKSAGRIVDHAPVPDVPCTHGAPATPAVCKFQGAQRAVGACFTRELRELTRNIRTPRFRFPAIRVIRGPLHDPLLFDRAGHTVDLTLRVRPTPRGARRVRFSPSAISAQPLDTQGIAVSNRSGGVRVLLLSGTDSRRKRRSVSQSDERGDR